MMKRILALLFHILFCFPFLLFLYFAGIENFDAIKKFIFIVCIALLLIIGIGQPKFYKISFQTDKLNVILFVLIGTLSTYSLQYFIGINPILSAGFVGFSFALLENKIQYIKSLPIYCGVFVGMTNPENHYPFFLIVLIGLFTGILFYLSKNFYGGIGGKLGTIAFSSVIAGVLIIKYYLNDFSI